MLARLCSHDRCCQFPVIRGGLRPAETMPQAGDVIDRPGIGRITQVDDAEAFREHVPYIRVAAVDHKLHPVAAGRLGRCARRAAYCGHGRDEYPSLWPWNTF